MSGVRDSADAEPLAQLVRDAFTAHRAGVDAALATLVPPIVEYAGRLARALQSGRKLLACGNGGSAAEAQHLVAELVGRFHRERRPLPAVALTTDTSILTALGNDYGYHEVFARQVEALGVPGDVLLLISTSGNSESILAAAERGRRLGLVTVGLTGQGGGKLAPLVDLAIRAPAAETARIQELHLLIDHTVCALVERLLGLSR